MCTWYLRSIWSNFNNTIIMAWYPIYCVMTLFNEDANDAGDYGFAIVASGLVTFVFLTELIAYRKLKKELKED